MAKLTPKQADDQIYSFIVPYVRAIERHVNYDVPVYYPGIDV